MDPPTELDDLLIMGTGKDVSNPILLWHDPLRGPWYMVASLAPRGGAGGSDGVRTRDRPVKSRVLYLTKLQTRPSESLSHFNGLG